MSTSASPSAMEQGERTTERTRRLGMALAATAAGFVLAVIWSFEFVDRTIGDNAADALLGYDAASSAISGAGSGAVFALVTGIAGTLTACNVAVFGALPQLACGPLAPGAKQYRRLPVWLGTTGWVLLGMLTVSAGYGMVAVRLADRLPQLSDATLSSGMPERLLQSSIVFGLIGLAFVYLGLTELDLVPDPFAGRPRMRLFVLGALVGGFLVGRPYPLFYKLLEDAVAARSSVYGALAFSLQSLGNVLVLVALAALFTLLTSSRAGRALAGKPHQVATISGLMLLALGTFLVVYWDVRLPARFGYGWFPSMPWN